MQMFVVPHVQSIVSCKEPIRFAVEALLRFHGDDEAPTRLIRHWEKTGYVAEIDKMMLREVSKHARECEYRHRMAVNVSARTLESEATQRAYLDELREASGQFSRLMVEITETWEIQNIDAIAHFAKQAELMGVYVGLDDCTPDHPLITHPNKLAGIKPRFIKIDASVVDDGYLEHSTKDLRRVARIAWAAGATTIAEGVDSSEKLAFVCNAGINYWQGFYADRPQLLDNLVAQDERAPSKTVRAEGRAIVEAPKGFSIF